MRGQMDVFFGWLIGWTGDVYGYGVMIRCGVLIGRVDMVYVNSVCCQGHVFMIPAVVRMSEFEWERSSHRRSTITYAMVKKGVGR